MSEENVPPRSLDEAVERVLRAFDADAQEASDARAVLEAAGVPSLLERNTQPVYGLDLYEPLPDNWTPLEVVVIAKCLDEDGDVAMHHTATAALNTWEALGMLRRAQLRLEAGLLEEGDGE